VVTSQPNLKVNGASGFEKSKIPAGANLFSDASKYVHADKNYVVLVDTSLPKFSEADRLQRNISNLPSARYLF